MKLRLCTQCDIGCFTDEDALTHEQKTGHKMDGGRDVTPIDHTNPSKKDVEFIKNLSEKGE